MDDSQASAILYYDTCDDFLLDIGSQLEQVLNPSMPVIPQKILGGASPLLPVLHLVITYGPIAGPAVAIFFKGVLSKAGEEFTSMIKDKLTRHKNNKLVRFIIVVYSKEITVSGYVKFDDYETITKALNSTPLMIDDAYQRKLTNPDQLPEGSPIYVKRYTQSDSDFQIQYEYDPAKGLWIPERFHRPTTQINKPD